MTDKKELMASTGDMSRNKLERIKVEIDITLSSNDN